MVGLDLHDGKACKVVNNRVFHEHNGTLKSQGHREFNWFLKKA